jgi:hypothetical protein
MLTPSLGGTYPAPGMPEVLTPFGKWSSHDVIAIPKGTSFNMTVRRLELRFLSHVDKLTTMKA